MLAYIRDRPFVEVYGRYNPSSPPQRIRRELNLLFPPSPYPQFPASSHKSPHWFLHPMSLYSACSQIQYPNSLFLNAPLAPLHESDEESWNNPAVENKHFLNRRSLTIRHVRSIISWASRSKRLGDYLSILVKT
jgi:hypothetical protein